MFLVELLPRFKGIATRKFFFGKKIYFVELLPRFKGIATSLDLRRCDSDRHVDLYLNFQRIVAMRF